METFYKSYMSVLFMCVLPLSPLDLSLVGAVGVLGEQTAAASAFKPGHFSAQERL